ncbi:hypothetical protein TNCV_807001 [Trichonephila clavipes]|nr:hypothetical protein TNCV_807001 [Trichonephila clavipes]
MADYEEVDIENKVNRRESLLGCRRVLKCLWSAWVPLFVSLKRSNTSRPSSSREARFLFGRSRDYYSAIDSSDPLSGGLKSRRLIGLETAPVDSLSTWKREIRG